MRKILLLFVLFTTSLTYGQENEKSIRDSLLNIIQSNFEEKAAILDSTVLVFDNKINDLDSLLKYSKSDRDKIKNILNRLEVVENKQKAIEESELYRYIANYQTAIVNLFYMDKEIKPVMLFTASESFFGELNDIGNPLKYEGFEDWLNGFKKHIEKNKKKEAWLNVVSTMINLAETSAKGTFQLSGPSATIIITAIDEYIRSLSKKQAEMRKKSEDMLELLAVLNQYNYDNNMINSQWEIINKELEELNKIYKNILDTNLQMINIEKDDFLRKFSKENNAQERLKYLTSINKTIESTVLSMKEKYSSDWKDRIYYNLEDIQSLKIRFGNVTFKIKENIKRYEDLINKYKNTIDTNKISGLEKSLKRLIATFDASFDPLDYIKSSATMYKVN